MNKVFRSILLLTLLINTGCSSENKINNNFDYYCYLIENQDLRLEDNTKQAISDDEKEEDQTDVENDDTICHSYNIYDDDKLVGILKDVEMYWEGDENYVIVLKFQYDYTSITLGYNEYPDSNVIERDFEFYRYDITTNELSEKDISDAVEKISPKVHDLLLEFDQDVYENLAKVYTFPSNYEYSHYGNVDNDYIWFLRDDEDGQYLYYGYDFENKFDNYYNQES